MPDPFGARFSRVPIRKPQKRLVQIVIFDVKGQSSADFVKKTTIWILKGRKNIEPALELAIFLLLDPSGTVIWTSQLGLILQISVVNLRFMPERLKRAHFHDFQGPCEPSRPERSK